MDKNDVFTDEYNKLNKAQKEAVDTTEGPVMVVAGPGTGKTQILALRIGNILKKGVAPADSILCLTFTRSGVKAMKNRLEEYIGKESNNVRISTFHSFANDLVEKHFTLLNFKTMPKLLEDDEKIFLADEIMEKNVWEYLRPMSNPTLYFNDLNQLISVLKRERLSPEEFLFQVESDIKNLKNDPDSISTRGESKGKLKKEIEKKIESLGRTREVVKFYELYEQKKIEESFMDYDDVLEYAVRLVEKYDDVRADIYENFLYVLVDEHQDSSGVQNNFLKAVWKDQDKPNIFVVGDDRQLIYAFSGAKLSYFEEFTHFFGKIKLITLVENYRSTSNILDLAEDLLSSSISKEKLRSNTKGKDKILLNEYTYPRDEIIGAGLYFKNKIAQGDKSEDCAILVPKNFHVRNAMQTLSNMGISVSTGKNLQLFNLREAQAFLRVLHIVDDPLNLVLLAESLLDYTSGVEIFEAHTFIKNTKSNKISINELINYGSEGGLFAKISLKNGISEWGRNLKSWVLLTDHNFTQLVSVIGNEFLINNSKNHEQLLKNVEIVRSFIHLALTFENKNSQASLKEFLEYLERLQSYGNYGRLATFGANKGVAVMTLHKSKGLEYKNVWIAHMNEETLMSEKKNSFTIPEKVKEHIHKRDVENAKRELYVAITRAKENCVLSYASENYTGGELGLAQIIRELPEHHFVKKYKEETEQEIIASDMGAKIFTHVEPKIDRDILEDIKNFVRENYADSRVSVSLLNNFFECPWKWYFRNFLKLPEVKSTSLALGSAVHSTIEFILKCRSLPSEIEIKERINFKLQSEGLKDEKELERIVKDAEKAVQNWIRNYYEKLEKDYDSERSIQFRDPKYKNLLMSGKIDLTERSERDGNRSVIITDFKTGKIKTKNEIEKLDEEGRLSSYMRQLAMYSYLVDGGEKGREVSISRLLFLEGDPKDKNSLYSTFIDQIKIDLLKKDISDYIENLENGSWVDLKCHHKSWGSKKEECEYCELAKRIT